MFIFVAILLSVFALGIYRWNWRGQATKIVTKILPYPAAIVDGSVILWSSYQENLATLERFYQIQRDHAALGSVVPSENEMQKRVLDRLIRDRLIENLAARYDISVSYDDVLKAYNQALINTAVTTAPLARERVAAELKAETTLKSQYGLSAGEYREKMLRPFLISQRLQEKLAQDNTLNADKLQKATEAADTLKSGRDFKETALKYSEDPNVNSTFGDRGLIGPGLFPSEVDEALSRAKSGDVLGPIKTSLGYHVLKVGDIKVVDSVRKTSVQEILVYPIQLDDWLEVRIKSASIIKFVNP